jgi:hypothetical protein
MIDETGWTGNITSIPERIRMSLQHDTQFLDTATYTRAYAFHELHWGIRSPAFLLYQNFFPDHPYPDVLPKKTENGLFIGVNYEILPDKRYKNYLASHEWWEHYIRIRPEGNLLADDERDYLLPMLERKRPAHRFAVLREFQQAQRDGTLSDYMDWCHQFYAGEADRITHLPDGRLPQVLTNYGQGATRDTIIAFIQKNLEIREEIFKTISNGK